MAEEKVGIKIEVDGSQVTKSVGNVRKELKEANAELIKAQNEFGQFSAEAVQAAKKVADLKDQIGDAAEVSRLFDPGAKFAAFSGAINAVAGGFAAVQGALGLVGVESEDLQKQLLKVQAALALSEGLSKISDAAKDFKGLKAVIGEIAIVQKLSAVNSSLAAATMKLFSGSVNTASASFKGLRTAIAATGIGVFVVALGAIVAYWDDIKGAIGGVTPEQKKLTELSQQNATAAKEALDVIDETENTLKKQGKTEAEILELRKKQTDEAIAAQKILIENEKLNIELAVAAEERNQKYVQGYLKVVTFIQDKIFGTGAAAINGLIGLINKIPGVDIDFKVNGDLVKDTNNYLTNLLFDPEETKKEGAQTIKDAEATLRQLQNKRDGYDLVKNDKKKKDTDKQKEIDEQGQKELLDLLNANEKARTDVVIESENERARKQIDIQEEQDKKRINATKFSTELKEKIIAQIEERARIDRQKLADKIAEDERKQAEEIAKKTAAVRAEITENSITDETERRLFGIRAKYAAEIAEVEKGEGDVAALVAALKERQQQEEDAVEKERKEKKAAERIAELEEITANDQLDFEARTAAIEQLKTLNQQYLDDKLISQEEFNKNLKGLAKAEVDIEQKKFEAKIAQLDAYSQAITGLGNLIGQNTAVGKALAIAAATIDTYTATASQFRLASQNPITLVNPAYPYIVASTALLSGLARVRQIVAVKVPNSGGAGGGASAPAISGGGGVGAPPISGAAPLQPQRPSAQVFELGQQSIRGINTATQRAYVVESDITSSQERVTRLNRAARLG